MFSTIITIVKVCQNMVIMMALVIIIVPSHDDTLAHRSWPWQNAKERRPKVAKMAVLLEKQLWE